MSDYSRTAIDDASEHARFSSYDVMRAGIDAELVKVATAVNSKVDDPSSQALTTAGANAITAGVSYVSLLNTSSAITATIATAVGHAGVFVVEDIDTEGTTAHTVTLTVGTWNGTNNTATFNAPGEKLAVYFNAAGRGTVLENTGSVGLSSV